MFFLISFVLSILRYRVGKFKNGCLDCIAPCWFACGFCFTVMKSLLFSSFLSVVQNHYFLKLWTTNSYAVSGNLLHSMIQFAAVRCVLKAVSIKCRLQTADCRLQTGYKMQTADYRLGIKCRLTLSVKYAINFQL